MILGIVLLLLALAIIIIGGLGLSSRLPGNSWIGIRVPEVRRDPELWTLAHKVAGLPWIISGIAMALAGIVAFSVSGWGWLWVLVGVIGSIAMLGIGAAIGANAVAMVDARKQAAADSADGCGCGDSCGSSSASDPSSDCGVAGGCGSCALNGTCEGGGERFSHPGSKAGIAPDLEGARKAARAADSAE